MNVTKQTGYYYSQRTVFLYHQDAANLIGGLALL
jgi:hypothetical protein